MGIGAKNTIELPIITESEGQDIVSPYKFSDFPIHNRRCSMDTNVVGSVSVKDSAVESPAG